MFHLVCTSNPSGSLWLSRTTCELTKQNQEHWSLGHCSGEDVWTAALECTQRGLEEQLGGCWLNAWKPAFPGVPVVWCAALEQGVAGCSGSVPRCVAVLWYRCMHGEHCSPKLLAGVMQSSLNINVIWQSPCWKCNIQMSETLKILKWFRQNQTYNIHSLSLSLHVCVCVFIYTHLLFYCLQAKAF